MLAALCCCSVTFIAQIHGQAQGQDLWKIPRTESEIVFDGIPDEPFWTGIEPFPLLTHLPVSGNTPV
jgi:hypothetical protein